MAPQFHSRRNPESRSHLSTQNPYTYAHSSTIPNSELETTQTSIHWWVDKTCSLSTQCTVHPRTGVTHRRATAGGTLKRLPYMMETRHWGPRQCDSTYETPRVASSMGRKQPRDLGKEGTEGLLTATRFPLRSEMCPITEGLQVHDLGDILRNTELYTLK